MSTNTTDVDCVICARATDPAEKDNWVYRDDHWLVYTTPPNPISGWLQIQSLRHATDISQFDDVEAAAFGPFIRRVEQNLIAASGAERIYLGSLCEGVHHFHAHLIPRIPEMPNGTKGWPTFLLLAEMNAGRLAPADETRSRGVLAEFARLMAA